MASLKEAIQNIPIIDHHAHNLLLSNELSAHPSLSITTEAAGDALLHAKSSLSHIRAVKQLSNILNCESTWEAVESCVEEERSKPNDEWAKRCFEGIETALIDDGLDDEIVHPFAWHDQLTRSKCKRIVRIEKEAEKIFKSCLEGFGASTESTTFAATVMEKFVASINQALSDPNVVGFKSIICYRIGLEITPWETLTKGGDQMQDALDALRKRAAKTPFTRLEDKVLNPYLLHVAAMLIQNHDGPRRLPLQFHTGLGDNDIFLSRSSPSLMQSFIKAYPKLPIILLHASYPFTKEAGYLSSVHSNVYMDIGEVFPMISQNGQEEVLRQALELCPSSKLMWSTDGHWFPETFLLATIQIREALQTVLHEYVQRKALSVPQAIRVAEDLLFHTANRIHYLDLQLQSLDLPMNLGSEDLRLLDVAYIHDADNFKSEPDPEEDLEQRFSKSVSLHERPWAENFSRLNRHLKRYPGTRFIRLQWLDYTSTQRLRVLPLKHALRLFKNEKFVGVTKAVFGLLQNDQLTPGFGPAGEYALYPCFETLRQLQIEDTAEYAVVQCEFREKNGDTVSICPRTSLRQVVEMGNTMGTDFLIGFEVEVVFINYSVAGSNLVFGGDPVSEGHSWSSLRAVHGPRILPIIETILDTLEKADIELQQWHPESAPGQYEFVLPPLPSLMAVDTLLMTRDIISAVAARNSLRATFVPKPFKNSCGTGAHMHMSMTQGINYKSFYAGVLKHLPGLAAFSYANETSYDRVADGVWSGGRWVGWGSENRELPLRKVEDSHWEIRCIDGFAQMFLLLAGILGAGLQGIKDEERLTWEDCPLDPAQIGAAKRKALGIVKGMPGSLKEAIAALGKDDDLIKIFGEDVVETYRAVKTTEIGLLDTMDTERRRNWLMERY